MSTALEYTVDANGHVSTQGTYREITEHDWHTLPAVRHVRAGRYGPLLDAVAQGKIIAVPTDSTKACWTVRRSIHLAAGRRGLRIETRRARDPETEKGVLVLVRAVGD